MADFQRSIADQMGVSLRTVRRWCERGRLPGVYRTKGGHWRIRRPAKARVARLSHRMAKAVRSVFPSGAILPPFLKARILEGLRDGTFEAQEAAFQLSLAALCARFKVSINDLCLESLHLVAPELAGIFRTVPVREFVSAKALNAAQEKPDTTRLITTAQKLANDGGRVSAAALAREMKMPRATFYRHFTGAQIAAARAMGFERADEWSIHTVPRSKAEPRLWTPAKKPSARSSSRPRRKA